MRILIQECLQANVTIDNEVISSINRGELIFVGFTYTDNNQIIDKMIQKLFKLRIFDDENGKTNYSLEQINGNLLVVSQFTLYADLKDGNRPSFAKAANSKVAINLYEYFKQQVLKIKPDAQFGRFGADMKVSLINDGPFTILLDSKELLSNEE